MERCEVALWLFSTGQFTSLYARK